MTSRTLSLIVAGMATLAWLGAAAPAGAQGKDDKDKGKDDKVSEVCRDAAKVLLDDDDARGHSGEHRNDKDREDKGKDKDKDKGRANKEDRLLAMQRLLTCGAAAGPVAASTIRGTKSLTDTAELSRLVGPYRNLRDTAVLNAAKSVAGDRTASVPARIFAIRTLWMLRTGKYWWGYEQLLPTAESTVAFPAAGCGRGIHMSDDTPYWVPGATPPAGYEAGIATFAEQLRADTSQPLTIRSAATCALLP